jgi:prolyl-tRNA synthetase
MRQSTFFIKVKKETPKDEKSINAQLLDRAGFVYKEMAGVYTYLPLGLRVLRKIENIIREEMENIGGREVLMTIFQPKNLWEETGRWSGGMGEIMYRCEDGEIGLGPTHEEMLTDIVRHYISSYRDLPQYIFQIQTKFRKELRAKSGLLRGREFFMKDLYSFHATQEDFQKYYDKVAKAYLKVFKRCGLEAIITEASGGEFTKDYTHEFQVLAKDGEDIVLYCPKKHFSRNKEILGSGRPEKCPVCQGELKEGNSIEVGNIFPLGIKYSQSMNAFFTDKNGEKKPIIMGCYGIGPSRTMGTIVEIHHDEKGIIWPKEVAPFLVHLIPVEYSFGVKSASKKIYLDLQKKGIEVLYDDREDKTAGQKFAEADLIGVPWRVVISEKTLKENSVEIKQRDKKAFKLIKLSQIEKYVK